MAKSRQPRDYITEYRNLIQMRQKVGFTPVKGSGDWRAKYLKRMARAQEKAIAAGETFTPQKARGHKPGEHKPRRLAELYRRMSIRIHHTGFFRLEELYANSPEHLEAIERARQYAIRHKGQHDWEWYQDVYDLQDDDLMLFAYGGGFH